MSLEKWEKIREIFPVAVEIPSPPERAEFLSEACAGDEELRREIEKLIAQDAEAGGLMSRPAFEEWGGLHALAASVDEADDPLIGGRVGKYRILREIGGGGMGVVYLAERADGSFEKLVAVKVVRPEMSGRFFVRRFRQERQLLSLLDHPFIAKLLDGGTTEWGAPYLVMEYIEGSPVDKYCHEHKLALREKLKLFRQVCEAVEYAHRRGVIHRDLKPSNILVKADGTPRLLDFGVAKVLNSDLLPTTTVDRTQTAMPLMTPEYASPEQLCGGAVTIASDVYSLGVVLYELVAGERPYRAPDRRPHGVSRGEEARSPGAEARLKVDGPLGWVVLKSLRDDPAERYQTAAEFVEDVARCLDGRPVAAPDPGHQPAANSIAVLPLKILRASPGDETADEFLSVGLADALIMRLSNVARFVVRPTSSVLRFAGDVDSFAAGRQLDVNFVVDGTIRRVNETLRVSVQLLSIADNSARWAQTFDERATDVLTLEDSISRRVAESLIPRLTGEERQRLEKRGTDKAEAHRVYLRGRFFWSQLTPESLPKALDSFRRAIALDPDYALAYVGVADYYNWAAIQGLLPPLECYRHAAQAARQALAIDDSLGEAYAVLGSIAHNRREWAEGERLYRRALELSPNDPHIHEWLGGLLVGTGRPERGVREMRRAEELNPLSLRTMTLGAWTTYQARLFQQAHDKALEVINLDKNYSQGFIQLGNCLIGLGRAEEAVAALRRGGQMVPDSAMPKYLLCFALVAAGRRAEARAVLDEMKRLAAGGYVKPYFMAMAHTALGERDAAFRYLELAFAEYDPWLIWFGTEPKLDPIRRDPRFRNLLRAFGQPSTDG